MNCQEFRSIVGAEPNSSRPEIAAHAAQCPACARHLQELHAMDRLLHRALNVDVAAAVPLRRRTWRPAWNLAASLLATVGLALSIWLAGSRETFADQVIDHVQHEAGSMIRTSASVDPARLAEILAASGLRLKPDAARVSYAMSCPFHGHVVPHLVVQTAAGPVTVLVMPEERARTRREQIDEDGFQGVIMPAPRGVLVVLGQNTPVDAVASTVLNALEYSGRPGAEKAGQSTGRRPG